MQSKTFSTLCSMDHLTKAWEDVKAKKASGGIDGESVASFEINLRENLGKIREELLQGSWEPNPYLRIEIPKKKTQKRHLGMLTVKDKIVQQAIRLLFELSCEKLFLPCSYGYRPGKGAVAAIRKTASLCRNPKNQYVLCLLYSMCRLFREDIVSTRTQADAGDFLHRHFLAKSFAKMVFMFKALKDSALNIFAYLAFVRSFSQMFP